MPTPTPASETSMAVDGVEARADGSTHKKDLGGQPTTSRCGDERARTKDDSDRRPIAGISPSGAASWWQISRARQLERENHRGSWCDVCGERRLGTATAACDQSDVDVDVEREPRRGTAFPIWSGMGKNTLLRASRPMARKR